MLSMYVSDQPISAPWQPYKNNKSRCQKHIVAYHSNIARSWVHSNSLVAMWNCRFVCDSDSQVL